MKTQDRTGKLGRRGFLAGAAATFTVIEPSLVRGSKANSTIALGMIGCGGRGNWIGKLFAAAGNYRFVSSSDYFQDRVDTFGEKFQVEPARRHATLSGYKRLLESELDAVVIETPPYFHPRQAAAAVEAGKHVFLAKPIAVDAPGCLSIADSGRRATADKLVFLVDFQTRANAFYREAARRVHAGDIGKLVCGEAHYPWRGSGSGTESADPEERLRRWYSTLALSGDVIVEQDIHALDVAAWFVDADPVRAFGTGGRGIRVYGNIWDHFSVTYWFPGDVVLTFTSVKMIPEAQNEISCRVFGDAGMVYADYYSDVWIRGKNPYPGGNVGNLFTDGAATNIKEFYRMVTEGDYTNPTVAPSVRSNLTSVLGRAAAYAGDVVTWDRMIAAGEKIEPDLRGLKS